jgi:hypothetical protein
MKYMIFIVCFFPCLNSVFGQSTKDSLRNRSMEQLMNIQKNIIGENSFIYYGKEYTGYDHQLEGDPYFLTDTMVASSVYYNGASFHDLRMLYNINLDAIIIYNPFKKQMISLPSEKIDSFQFLGRVFIWLATDSSTMNSLKTGFYDRAYSGNSSVFIRQLKFIIQPINPRDPSRFVQKTSYFIRRKGKYFPIESQNELLNVFQDKKKQVMKYLHSNKLRYRKNAANTLVKAAQFYDQLN